MPLLKDRKTNKGIYPIAQIKIKKIIIIKRKIIMKQIIKTIIVTVALFAFAHTVSNIALLAQFDGGDGTEESPYQIRNKIHFNLLTDSTNMPITPNWSSGKYFILTDNITDTVRTIIGNISSYNNVSFQGNFNGNGFKIVLGISVQSNNVGLFGMLGNNSSISNVAVEGYVKGLDRVGGIAGYTESYNCNIENCINNAKISGRRYTSGIIGYNVEGNITNCTNTGEISSIIDRVGGIAGIHNGGTMKNCRNSGRISGESFVGGLSGRLYNDGKIINCINIGSVKGNYLVGGISTSADEGPNIEISNCVNSGLIIGNDRVGGILGYISSGTISNCINIGTVKGNIKTGCIVGEKAGGTVTNCHYDMQMCGEE